MILLKSLLARLKKMRNPLATYPPSTRDRNQRILLLEYAGETLRSGDSHRVTSVEPPMFKITVIR